MASLVLHLVKITALGPPTLFCFCSSGLLSYCSIFCLIKSSLFDLVVFANLVLDTIIPYADAVYYAVVPYMIAFAVGNCVLEWVGVVRIGEGNDFLRQARQCSSHDGLFGCNSPSATWSQLCRLIAIIVVMMGKNGGNKVYKMRSGRHKLNRYT